MSQVGTIVSATSNGGGNGGFNVEYQYALDAGGTQLAELIGVAGTLWGGPGGTITVSPNPPGTSNPVTLACPFIVAIATYNAMNTRN